MIAPIDNPGVYRDIPKAAYHGQLTVGPSLGRSMAHLLVSTCPQVLFERSYLNPHFEAEQKQEFIIGDAAHLIVLEPEQWGDRVAIVEADDYKTKAAKEARDAAYDAGKTPLLPKQRDHILAMHRALIADPDARKLLTGGENEMTFVARDPETSIWLKARTDKVHLGHGVVVDYKTSGSAHPQDFASRVYDQGYYIQDPWYRDVIGMATGETMRQFVFVVQEPKPPYALSINTLGQQDVEWGRLQSGRAIDIFARCLASGRWPGYGRNQVTMKAWAHYELAELQGAGQAERLPRPTREQIQRAIAAQAPA